LELASLFGLGYGILALLAPFIVLVLTGFILYEAYRGGAHVSVSFDAGNALAAFMVSGALYMLAFAVFALAYAVNPQAFNQTTFFLPQP